MAKAKNLEQKQEKRRENPSSEIFVEQTFAVLCEIILEEKRKKGSSQGALTTAAAKKQTGSN